MTPISITSGTPSTCPPEWFNQRCYHAIPAAVWSLGVLLYEMLQCDFPFKRGKEIVLEELKLETPISQGRIIRNLTVSIVYVRIHVCAFVRQLKQ